MKEAGLTEEEGIERGRGNVYADLGLPDPEGLMAQSHMILAIKLAMEARGLTKDDLSELTSLEKEEVVRLLKGPREEFPLRRLAGILTALDRDVTITIRERPQGSDRGARILVETV